MKLDETFAREIKKVNGNGSRESRFEFLNTARLAAREMSTPSIINDYCKYLEKYGRATVAICTAVTISAQHDRLNAKTVMWADEVLNLWTNRPSDIFCLEIMDNLHPTRIEEYAASLIKITQTK